MISRGCRSGVWSGVGAKKTDDAEKKGVEV